MILCDYTYFAENVNEKEDILSLNIGISDRIRKKYRKETYDKN